MKERSFCLAVTDERYRFSADGNTLKAIPKQPGQRPAASLNDLKDGEYQNSYFLTLKYTYNF